MAPENQNHIEFARQLRQSSTDAERALWDRLQNRQLDGVKFRRQRPLGPYIIDFISFERRVVIELDGGQHGEDREAGRDEERTAWLKVRGYEVLRFWNNEVLRDMEAVLERIMEAMK